MKRIILVIVAQLAEQSLPTQEDPGSNPAFGNFINYHLLQRKFDKTSAVVFGGKSHQRSYEFESFRSFLDGWFFTFICCMAFVLIFGKTKNKRKEAADAQLKKECSSCPCIDNQRRKKLKIKPYQKSI